MLKLGKVYRLEQGLVVNYRMYKDTKASIIVGDWYNKDFVLVLEILQPGNGVGSLKVLNLRSGIVGWCFVPHRILVESFDNND